MTSFIKIPQVDQKLRRGGGGGRIAPLPPPPPSPEPPKNTLGLIGLTLFRATYFGLVYVQRGVINPEPDNI